MAKIYVTTRFTLYTIIDGVPTSQADIALAGEAMLMLDSELHIRYRYRNCEFPNGNRVTSSSDLVTTITRAATAATKDKDVLEEVYVNISSVIQC